MAGDGTFDVSFSGLKTAVINHVRKHPDVSTADVAASFQEAVVDVLVTKARAAAREVGAKGLCLGGGVAANSRLRERLLDACVRGRPPGVPAQPGHVHRQRRHGGQHGLVPLAQRRPVAPRHRRLPQPRHLSDQGRLGALQEGPDGTEPECGPAGQAEAGAQRRPEPHDIGTRRLRVLARSGVGLALARTEC